MATVTRTDKVEGPPMMCLVEFEMTREQVINCQIPTSYADRLKFRALLLECGHFFLQDNDEGNTNLPEYHVGDRIPCRKCLQNVPHHTQRIGN